MRKCGRNFVTKDGKIIPSGSCAILAYILPLRDPAVFGRDADEYNPDRWIDPTPEMNANFLPFAMGKQNCVGQSLANAELHAIVPRIIERFELTLENEGTAEYFLTLKPANCILKARPLK